MSGKQQKRHHRALRQGPHPPGQRDQTVSEATYQARVAHVLGGQQPQLGPHGVRALFRCNVCAKPWLQDPAALHRARLFLTEDEVCRLVAELGADLGTLPYATCRACAALRAIGELGIDEYGQGRGYGISWEGTEPPGGHLLATVLGEAWLAHLRGQPPQSSVVTEFPRARALFGWLQTLAVPAQYWSMNPADSQAIAAENRPGHDAPGTDGWVWRGAFWRAECPPLGGRVLVNLAQALPPDDPYRLAASVALLRVLALHLLAGGLAGELLLDE